MARMAALALLAIPCGNAVASEPQQTLVGELAVLHTDGEPGGGSTDSYALATASGEVEVLFTGAHPTYALEGSVVQLEGTRTPDGSLHVDLAADPGALSVLASGGNGGEQLAVTSARNVLVMLVNFSDNRVQPYTAAQATAGMFGATGSVDALYRDSSYGLLDLTGEVRGWYELNASSAGCDVYHWMDMAMSAAVAQGVNLASFQHYVLAFPSAGACGWAGLGTLGGSYTWINTGTFDVAVAAHELGHNLGFHHASSYACTSAGVRVVLSASSTCTGPNGAGEYGDPFDVMGGAWNLRQFGAFHKNKAGWLGTSQTVTTTGTYALTSASFASTGARALRIARPNGEELWLELRSPSGEFDDFGAGDAAVTGVTARVAKPGYLVQTKLLDCNPEQSPLSQSFANAALQPGQSFTDPVSGVSVRTDSVGPLGASVTVTFPAGGAVDTTAPATPSLTGGPDRDRFRGPGLVRGQRPERNRALRGAAGLVDRPDDDRDLVAHARSGAGRKRDLHRARRRRRRQHRCAEPAADRAHGAAADAAPASGRHRHRHRPRPHRCASGSAPGAGRVTR